ncbi:MAG: glycosyltransferase [Acidimicrobiales bacterium]
MTHPLRFLFMPESAYGPTNNCVGIADVLRRKGHSVVFAAEASWTGKLEALGFEEDLVDLAPSASEDVEPGKFWTDFIRETAPVFRSPTIEQIERFVRPTWAALIDGARYCRFQLEAIIERHRPDAIVEDNVICFPPLVTAGVPFVRIVSCNPLEMKGPQLPPAFSGYPLLDRTGWEEFRTESARVLEGLWGAYSDWVISCGAPALSYLDFIHESTDLNLYLYPEVIDYTDLRPLGARWHRLDSSVRATDGPFELPEPMRHGDGALVYLSLGSLGSADVDLMRRLVRILSETPHRYIVSKGPLAGSYDLAENMWGAPQVPQTTVLPLVDLVITHGGNNTTTECLHFGKPMIVLPLFWDQHDNAQRVAETGLGRRLRTYEFEGPELVGAVDELWRNEQLRHRMAGVGQQIRSRGGTERAARLIEVAALRRRRSGAAG